MVLECSEQKNANEQSQFQKIQTVQKSMTKDKPIRSLAGFDPDMFFFWLRNI